jgi:hypothetical protein
MYSPNSRIQSLVQEDLERSEVVSQRSIYAESSYVSDPPGEQLPVGPIAVTKRRFTWGPSKAGRQLGSTLTSQAHCPFIN